jgi:tetratricopeptide (TPR) repeat protein
MAEPEAPPLSRGKTAVFGLVTLLVPVLAFGLIEAGFRLASAGAAAEDPYINISPFSMFSRLELNDEAYYRITHRYGYAKRKTTFPIRKPANGLRIIALGGSACAGWPHNEPETFERYLEQALAPAFPDRKIEVINAGAHGFASYRLRRIFDEILPLDPDAVILYSGNNEFLEDREYRLVGRRVVDALSRNLRSVQWLRERLSGPRMELPGEKLQDARTFFWKKAKGEALELRKNPAKFADVKAHYAASIEYMVGEAGKRGVPVLLFTVPVNLRDWLPTASHSRLEGEAQREWQRFYHLGQRGLLQGDTDAGIQWMRRAIELEPEHAASHFWLGRLLEKEGQTGPALESYKRARDLDYNPFRAHGDFNLTLRRIASERDHALLVDLEREFERASRRGIPGFDLFLDYVHPTKRGNLVIAEAAFRTLVQDGVLPAGPRTVEFRREDELYGSEGEPYDERNDLKLQTRLYKIYALNQQHQAAIDQIEHVLRLAKAGRADGDVWKLKPAMKPELEQAYNALQRYEALRRRDILGLPVESAERELAKQRLEAFYEERYDFDRL